MDNCIMIFISIGIGGIISVGSMVLGAWLFDRVIARSGSGGFLGEPKGDVFTIETADDETLFPEDEENENEQHVLERTNKFLEALRGKV